MYRRAGILLLVLCSIMICGEVFAARSWWEKLLHSNPEQDQQERTAEILQTPEGQLAKKFAQRLLEARFAEAHTLLSRDAQTEWPVAKLEKTYKDMVGYFLNPPRRVMPTMTMQPWQWPDSHPNDVAWVYTAIEAEGDNEGIVTIISKENGADVIRWLEWGRP